MNTAWILIIVGVAGAVVALVTSWYRHDNDADLGAVSQQWIAEHRLGQGHDSQR